MQSNQSPANRKNQLQIAKILTKAFGRKQAARPEYSRRSLARDLGVSPAFVTNVFKGKKSLPLARLTKIARHLELDIHERDRVLELVAREAFPTGLPAFYGRQNSSDSVIGNRQVHDGPNTHLLSNWYIIAILEGIGLKSPHNSIAALRERFRLTQRQMDEALECLLQAGVIEMKDGTPKRIGSHLYIPSGRSKKEIRSYHEKMILKAREELAQKISDTDFHRRLITGFTFSVHQDDIESLKANVLKFLDSFSRKATGKKGTDVFQCNIQFFPLTDLMKK